MIEHLHVLTPTGERHEAMEACAAMMAEQDYKGKVTWVVVDDGPDPTNVKAPEGWELEYIRPEVLWCQGMNTQASNLISGLSRIPCHSSVVIVEDDDAYAPWWLSACAERLEEFDLVGENMSLYVNIKTGRKQQMANVRHASLCATAFRGEDAFKAFWDICEEGGTLLDVKLWQRFSGSKKLYSPEPKRGVIGRKGWPGRPGIGVGHKI